MGIEMDTKKQLFSENIIYKCETVQDCFRAEFVTSCEFQKFKMRANGMAPSKWN